jgi:HD-like signal output (HDOD) protein
MRQTTASAETPGPTTRDNVRTLFARVAETCDLPPLPAVAMRAMRLARDPDAKADDLARVVSSDAAIAARVLRIARSAIYVRRNAPRTLREAIMTVGFHALRKILVAASARSIYRADDAVAAALWEHALATALAADELSRAAGEAAGGDGFIAGLLHDVGRLVFHLADQAAYASLGHADEHREQEVFGVTHAAVGGCLAEQWGLEDEVVEGILFHHTPGASRIGERIAAADRIAHEIGFGSVQDPVAPERACGDDGQELCERIAQVMAAERTLFD